MESIDGVIEQGYKVNDNKVIILKIVESPSFQFSITQQFLDIKENERLISEGLPLIQISSLMTVMTYPESCVVFNFLFEYVKEFQKANKLMAVPV
jgi:ferritin